MACQFKWTHSSNSTLPENQWHDGGFWICKRKLLLLNRSDEGGGVMLIFLPYPKIGYCLFLLLS